MSQSVSDNDTRNQIRQLVNEIEKVRREYVYLRFLVFSSLGNTECVTDNDKKMEMGNGQKVKINDSAENERENWDHYSMELAQLSSERDYLQKEIKMLEEEGTDLLDAIEAIASEKASIQKQMKSVKEELESSKHLIDLLMEKREGLLKDKETKSTMIATFEALFRNVIALFLFTEQRGISLTQPIGKLSK